jgi:hypothetical protein
MYSLTIVPNSRPDSNPIQPRPAIPVLTDDQRADARKFKPPPNHGGNVLFPPPRRIPKVWVPAIPADWRKAAVKIGCDRYGRLSERQVGTFPSVSFDPAKVLYGDRIGCFTTVSSVKVTDTSIVQGYDGPCYYVDVICDCGWLISDLQLLGDSRQKLSCGHLNGMNPEHNRNPFKEHAHKLNWFSFASQSYDASIYDAR